MVLYVVSRRCFQLPSCGSMGGGDEGGKSFCRSLAMLISLCVSGWSNHPI